MSDAPHIIDVDFQPAQERRGADRRRAQPRRLDTLFAATLVNHVADAEKPRQSAYPAMKLRAGARIDVKA